MKCDYCHEEITKHEYISKKNGIEKHTCSYYCYLAILGFYSWITARHITKEKDDE